VDDAADLERITGAARHLLSLIDQVLDLAKVDSGRMVIECAPVVLDEVLEDVDAAGRTLAPVRGNRWICRLLSRIVG